MYSLCLLAVATESSGLPEVLIASLIIGTLACANLVIWGAAFRSWLQNKRQQQQELRETHNNSRIPQSDSAGGNGN